mmetsp:Transcript_48998/g.100003  ORF Transcript_48998/g.100003 Transcript_48998/m.100003 type:complete len:84 (-) Transcript_48998:99-350(-)
MKMINSGLLKVCFIVVVSVLVMFKDDIQSANDFVVKDDGDIFLPAITNAGNHVYPYTATIVSLTCLIVMIMIIICFGAELGGE